jgi:cytochrome c-type biogenesis protein CcmH/NrfF
MLLLAALVLLPDAGIGSHDVGHHTAPVGQKNPPANDAEARVMKQFVCICGKCPRTPADECECNFAATMRAKIKQRIAAGDDVRAAMIAEHGESVLAEKAPPRPPFLKWFPIALFAGGAALVILLAQRSKARRS